MRGNRLRKIKVLLYTIGGLGILGESTTNEHDVFHSIS